MNKKLFPLLLILALFIWGYNIYQVRQRLTPSVNTVNDASTKLRQGSASRKAVAYDATLRDPFEAPGTPAPVAHGKPKAVATPAAVVEPPPFAINGIMWDAKAPSAFLADTRSDDVMMVNNGTVWNDLKVVTITQNTIKVKYKGKDFELR